MRQCRVLRRGLAGSLRQAKQLDPAVGEAADDLVGPIVRRIGHDQQL